MQPGWPVSGNQAPFPQRASPWLPLTLALLTAGWARAVHGRDPEVGGASVKDDGEVLRWRANGDGAKVFCLWGREGREESVGGGKGEGAHQGGLGRALWGQSLG